MHAIPNVRITPKIHIISIDVGKISRHARTMMEIDQFDRQILRELQRDASLGVEELGERIGLSRNACWRRVKRLEEAKIIKAKVALVDPEALGLELTVFISVRTDRHDPDWLQTFTSAVRDMPEVLGVWRTSGELDYLLKARVSSVREYDALYLRLIRRVEIADISASFVMEDIKDTTEMRTDCY